MIPDKKTLKKIWAEVPHDYYFRLNFLQQIWHDQKWLVFKNLLLKNRVSPKKILEVGCSAGHLSALFSELFPLAKITGIDVYVPAIKEAQKRFPKIKFQYADAHKLPFKSGTFDFVICSETIEHVVDPGKVLREIRRVLQKKGVAIVEMDSGSLLFRLIWFFWTHFFKGKVWKNAHLHPFSHEELEATILDEQFTIVEKRFSHFGMAVSFLLSRN